MLDTNVRSKVQPLFEKVADYFIRHGLTANHVTIMALFVGLIPTGMLFLTDMTVIPVVILWMSGMLDAVDGTIARKSNSSTLFGTIMDITFDRIVEIGLLIGLAYRQPGNQFLYVVLASSIILSLTVFLTVAAASEKVTEKTFYYQPGLAERTEGFIMFSLLILLPEYAYYILIIFIGMILFTAIQRFRQAYEFFAK